MYPKKKIIKHFAKNSKTAKVFTAKQNREKIKGYLGNNSDDYNLSANFSGWEEVLDK